MLVTWFVHQYVSVTVPNAEEGDVEELFSLISCLPSAMKLNDRYTIG